MQMTPAFEQALAKLMKARGIKTKSEAIRVAVEDALRLTTGRAKAANFDGWIGLGTRAPQNARPRFARDGEMWE